MAEDREPRRLRMGAHSGKKSDPWIGDHAVRKVSTWDVAWNGESEPEKRGDGHGCQKRKLQIWQERSLERALWCWIVIGHIGVNSWLSVYMARHKNNYRNERL